MKKKRAAAETETKLPCRIMTYGCMPPTVGMDQILQDLESAHKYYNVLVGIELKRRERFRAARSAAAPELAGAEAELERLEALIEAKRGEVRALRQKTRKREKHPELQEEIKRLSAAKKEQVAVVRAARKAANEDGGLKAEAAKIDAEAVEEGKAARAACGLYWGTYLLVEQAVKAAAGSRTDPRPKRNFDGSGRIGVQLQQGMNLRELFGCQDTRLRIEPLPVGQLETRSGRRHAMTKLSFRIGSTEKGAPIWAEFPVKLHREMPSDAMVKWAWIKIRKYGARRSYELQLTVTSLGFRTRRPDRGTIAMDVGWRQKDDGSLRVGMSVDDEGRVREYCLSAAVIDDMNYPDRLRSIRDRHFDAAKAFFGSVRRLAPADVQESSRGWGAWKRQRHLDTAIREWTKAEDAKGLLSETWQAWKAERLAAHLDLLDSPPAIMAWAATRGLPEHLRPLLALELWRRKDLHLREWEKNHRRRTFARRKDIYRNWAAELARYERVVLEEFDLRTFATAPKPEEDAGEEHRRQQRMAAISELRLCITTACGLVQRMPERKGEGSTLTCHQCLAQQGPEWDRSKELVHTCEACGATWDQDENAARNLLRTHQPPAQGDRPETTLDRSDEWDRALALSAE